MVKSCGEPSTPAHLLRLIDLLATRVEHGYARAELLLDSFAKDRQELTELRRSVVVMDLERERVADRERLSDPERHRVNSDIHEKLTLIAGARAPAAAAVRVSRRAKKNRAAS